MSENFILVAWWEPRLCCKQAVFFQYLVGHSGPQYKGFKKSQESRPLLTTALQTATFSYAVAKAKGQRH